MVKYLTIDRKSNFEIASLFLDEARYRINGNIYKAISFRNDLGGYELKKPIFKGAISPKYYSTIPGQVDGINLF